MSKLSRPRNPAASIRQRLLDHARREAEDFQYVLTRYGMERLLYRIAESPHGAIFVLKGAVLFQLWTNTPHRPTRDIDLLGRGEAEPEAFADRFRLICATTVREDDGLRFDPTSVRAEQIKEEDEYQGIRVRLAARLEAARIPLQVDIGFGDTITPGTTNVEYPTLLNQDAPSLPAYPRETVIAEKFQALVMLGITNSRMKDFFDLWVLANQFAYEGPVLQAAIAATFARRGTALPGEMPLAMTPTFFTDRHKTSQWQAFLRKGRLSRRAADLPDVLQVLRTFLLPPAHAAREGKRFTAHWHAGQWHEVA